MTLSTTQMHTELIDLLRRGGIGVMPTDTMYGLVASALDASAVERVFVVRKRTPSKPLIILIPDMAALEFFGVSLGEAERTFLEKAWPAPLSVVLPAPGEKWAYLRRGGDTLSFRVPADESLRELLVETGPLVAPSANFEGEKPAETIEEAERYFSDTVDFYVDGGVKAGLPSTLISFKEGKPVVLREGAYRIL